MELGVSLSGPVRGKSSVEEPWSEGERVREMQAVGLQGLVAMGPHGQYRTP